MKKMVLIFIFSLFLAANVFAEEAKEKPKASVKPAKKVYFFQLMANWVKGISSAAARKPSLVFKTNH